MNTKNNDVFGEWLASDEFKALQKAPAVEQPKRSTKPKHKCDACNGTGVWVGGYVNRYEGKCRACNGKGGFKSSAEDRAKAKLARQRKAKEERKMNVKFFCADHKDLYIFLALQFDKNDFARSLVQAIHKYGDLTEKQLAAAYRMLGRQVAYEEGKKKEAEPKAVVDLTIIKDKLLAATDKGKKARLIAGEGYKFTLAPDSGKNPGCVYVAFDGDYLAKITPTGELLGYKLAQKHIDSIQAIAKDPLTEVRAYGQRFGKCGVCNRTLTNKISIERGIGPICEGRIG